ncbi:MAG: hypothetical protein BRC29_04575 [Nanohaloarchaea archaeon SW_7_43_1]|nr:MAG: hypothetical protein BRC29_04575 [Nanohaloarchaea archaeon SW_7_43_1]
MAEDDSPKVERGKDRMERGRKELEKQLGARKELVDGYTEYYRNNRNEIVEDFLGNFDKTKKPAIAGIIVLTPILITLFIIDWTLDKINQIPYIEFLNLTDKVIINESIKLVFIISLGAFLATSIGRTVQTKKGFKAERLMDRFVDKIPFLGTIYSIAKVTADTVFNGADEFSDPVKLEVHGMKVTGYRTGNTLDGKEIIFVPTSPNVTTGFVVEIDPEEVIETEDTPREAFTRTLSAGFGEAGPQKPKRSPVKDGNKKGDERDN